MQFYTTFSPQSEPHIRCLKKKTKRNSLDVFVCFQSAIEGSYTSLLFIPITKQREALNRVVLVSLACLKDLTAVTGVVQGSNDFFALK